MTNKENTERALASQFFALPKFCSHAKKLHTAPKYKDILTIFQSLGHKVYTAGALKFRA